jgi:hypothetical protein
MTQTIEERVSFLENQLQTGVSRLSELEGSKQNRLGEIKLWESPGRALIT